MIAELEFQRHAVFSWTGVKRIEVVLSAFMSRLLVVAH